VDRCREKYPNGSDHTASMQGYVMTFGGLGASLPALVVESRVALTTKSGAIYIKKSVVHVVASYCPFCGVAIARGSNANT
jgi:hypothetical protein